MTTIIERSVDSKVKVHFTTKLLNLNFDGTLRVAGSIPARNKHLYGPQVVVPGLAVCVGI